MTNNLYRQRLIDNGFTDALATQFSSRYEVLSPSLGGVGFSATLFLDKSNNQKILAVRGTNDFLDLIIADGLILTGTSSLIQPQYTALQNYFLQLKDELKIQPNEQITVAGHSLGGFLAQLLSVDQAATVRQTFTYNAPGIGGAAAQFLESLGIAPANIPLAQITNIISQNGFSATAGLGTQLGSVANIFIEANLNPVHNHSIETATDALALYDVYATVDRNLDVVTMRRILEAASNSADKSLEAGLDALRRLFRDPADQTPFVSTPTSGSADDRNAYYTNLLTLKKEIPTGTYGIVDLAGTTATDLTNLAKTNIAYRYAVRELNPFVVAGVDYQRLHNAQGELELETADGSGTLTTAYLTDRAAFLAEKLNFNTLDASVNALSTTRYEDRATNYTIPPVLALRSYIFGQDAPEAPLVGGLGEDHLYGAGGNDTLDGGRGADYLEGGRDDDTYLVDDVRDRVVEFADQGTDTVQSSVDIHLAANVEKLVFADGFSARGNALNNELTNQSAGALLNGGQGDDTYILDAAGTLVEAAGEGVDTVKSRVSATLGRNLENLTLMGEDAIDGTGNDQDNTLTGNNGANELRGEGGSDTLIAGAGDDLLSGGTGNDVLRGGEGLDLYLYTSATDGNDVIEDADARGLIVVDGQVLQGGIRPVGESVWTSPDGQLQYRLEGSHLKVNVRGHELAINEDFQNGQFGIRLTDGPSYANELPDRTKLRSQDFEMERMAV